MIFKLAALDELYDASNLNQSIWVWLITSAASRCILVPFEWYGGPKKVIVLFLPYIFHVKTKWNIVYEYLKTKIFSRDTNILPQMHRTSNVFEHSPKTIAGFWVSLDYPIQTKLSKKRLDAALIT